MLFDLSPAQFDRIEVGRVGRQVAKGGTCCLNELTNAFDLVGRQVVHDHNLAGLELWAQHVFQIGQEHIPIGRCFNRHRSHPSVDADSSQQSQRAPIAGSAVRYTFAHWTTSISPRHLRGGAAFIEENQIPNGHLIDGVAVLLALFLNPFGILLSGVKSFF